MKLFRETDSVFCYEKCLKQIVSTKAMSLAKTVAKADTEVPFSTIKYFSPCTDME